MATGSVKRPLLLYAVVFALALTFGIITVAISAQLKAAQRVYRESRLEEVRALAGAGPLPAVFGVVARRTLLSADQIGVVTATATPYGITLALARRSLIEPDSDRNLACASVRAIGPEAYVVQRLDPFQYLGVARTEIQRLVFSGVAMAVVAGALLALMTARLVLPPLSALQKLAADARLSDAVSAAGIAASGGNETPNEIADVAAAFRRTLRELALERQALERQHRELERMQESLIRAEKLASVGRLAAGVAHEIGNPLAAVVGYLSLARSGGLDPEAQRDVLERSVVQLNRINDTIKKLLTYARPEGGGGANEPISTSSVLADSLLLLKAHPGLRGVEINNQLQLDPRPDAEGRTSALGQVLVNLLINAGQAMKDQSAPAITIERTLRDRRVELSITDNGPGVPEDRLEEIFDPFYTTKPPGEGTGLGLAVSRSLMESMGGRLEIEAGRSTGACFRVELPAHGGPPDNSGAA
jgi:C4-dicarboxylate-specific signal transduction histidine kinase